MQQTKISKNLSPKSDHQKVNSQPLNLQNNPFDIVTPVNPQRLQHWLSDYNESDKKFLVDGFTEGFKIPFQGVREQRFCNNLKSADQNLSILQEKNK